MKRGYLVVALTFVVLTALSISAVAADTIKIGVAAPLTGPLAPYGEGVRDGAILAVEQANAKEASSASRSSLSSLTTRLMRRRRQT